MSDNKQKKLRRIRSTIILVTVIVLNTLCLISILSILCNIKNMKCFSDNSIFIIILALLYFVNSWFLLIIFKIESKNDNKFLEIAVINYKNNACSEQKEVQDNEKNNN